jgi:hypothetical protein
MVSARVTQMARVAFVAFVLTALAAGAIGFGASRFLDNGLMKGLEADRDRARDCRRSGATLPPCPVEYRNTRIEWRDKIETKPTPDPKQAERIDVLSADLADAQRRIGDLEHRLSARWAPRVAGYYYYLQNGSMAHPYARSDRCPAGTEVVYEATPSPGSMLSRRSGDPDVCYVRIR